MENTSDRINRLSGSQTLIMAQKTRALKEQGVDMINLCIGEPDFDTPKVIKEAAKKAIDDNFSHYTPIPGFPDLLDAIVAKFDRENNLKFKRENIIVSNGAKQCLANIILSTVDKTDEVIIPTPYWVTYSEMVKLAHGTPVFVKASIENDFKITPQQLESAITPKTKAFMICSPSNPTGSLYNREELKALADVLARHPKIVVISDEIYEHINFIGKHESIAQFENIKEQTVIVNGVSKAYAMTGWRIGYIAAPEWIARACQKIQGQYTSGACAISQKAAIAALNECHDSVVEMRKVFHKRKNLVTRLLKDIKGIKTTTPTGAFYSFPDVSYYFGKSDGKTTINNATELTLYILDNAHVGTVTGSAFGDDNCIRISYAASEKDLTEALYRIKKLLGNLK